MKRLVVVLTITLALGFLAEAQSNRYSDSKEQAFQPGGKVNLKLSSGDYTIRAGRDDRILVRWLSKDRPVDIERYVRITSAPTSVTLRTDGPSRDTECIIEIPARSDVYLRVRAGDITIKGIEGNKDIQMTAGDLEIDMNPASYSLVRASVTFGDLDAPRLAISKGGIGRSFDWQGSGTFYLRAKLFAGDLKLR